MTVSWVKPEKQITQKPGQSIVTTGTVHLIRSRKRRLLITDVLLKFVRLHIHQSIREVSFDRSFG